MGENQLLKEVGSKLLDNPLPASKDALINLLTQAATSLCGMDQSPPKGLLDSMQPLLIAIVKPQLLKHQDDQVKLLVATCTCEILRITAPDPPYDDDVLKDIFHLFVSTFSGLKHTKDPSFGRIVNILETVAKYRSFVVMLDLECDELVNQMFKTFFTVASDEHPIIVTASMETIMAVLLEESEDIGMDLLLIPLSMLGHDKKDVTPHARTLAMNVIGQCAGKLEHGIKQIILSSVLGDKRALNPQIDYHGVIYDIYRCAPQVLFQIVPYLSKDLLTDEIDLRLERVRLVGNLFALKGTTVPETFHPLFLEFLKRLNDKAVEVRKSVLEHVKLCLLSDTFRSEAPKIVDALRDRLLDDDESIRKQVVAVISDVASQDLSSVSADTIKHVAERLEDKSILIRKYTMERLSDIYRTWCLKQIGVSNFNDDFDWIPGKLLKCYYYKDLGPNTVEQILCNSLFPVDISIRYKVKTWVKLFSKFDKVELNALEKILEQKERLQLEVQKYLLLRKTYKDGDASELQKKTTVCIRSMAHCFVDSIKAETDLQLLDQSKDANIWRILTKLLDPNSSCVQSRSLQDELLKIVGEKDPLYELLRTLCMKCSYTIYDKEFVKDLILEVDLQKSEGNKVLTRSCMNILVIVACFSPLLLSGMKEDLVHLLEDDDEAIKEGVLHVLSKAGETIREQLGESSSSIDLILEKICLEGSRRQAKYAVNALAAITKDEGLKSLSVLYKRLVDMLIKRTNLPSVLQSLGCIAQTAMPVFETQESKVVNFIRKDILRRSQRTGDVRKESWEERSEICSLKVFGIKVLVKSYLPVKDAHLRVGIDELIKDLQTILTCGEISTDVESSSVDKAHLKLASANAIIRLSKYWNKKISIKTFYLTLKTSEVGFPKVRELFLNKVHKYIKDGSLDPKYVCAFFLDFESHKSILEKENQYLRDIIQISGNSSAVWSEYLLPYLIHALAHHPSFPNIDECKDVKAYEPIYRKLYIFFSKLAHGDEDGKSGVLRREEYISIISILRNIKRSKDAVDTNKSKNLYAICDLCLSIIKRLARKQDLQQSIVPVSLPEVLYTPLKKKEENNEDNEEGYLKDEKKEESKEGKKNEENKDDKQEENKENEKKEESDQEVSEGLTWLTNENALAYFESLIFYANGNVASKTNEDDIAQDIETDGNDVPLGKILKRIKAKASKGRKVLNNGSTPAAVETENNVDILGMLREINSGDMDVPNKFESSNGHGNISSEAKLKRKGISNDLPSISVPKRRRSSSAKSHKRPSFLKGGSAFDIIKMDDPHSGPEDKVTEKGLIHNRNSKKTDEVDLEKGKRAVKTDSSQKSGRAKKRKQRRVSRLAKCAIDESESNIQELIGRHIKVWWPMDKEFYNGVVKAYDDNKKKHVVSYDDGEVEILCLDKERWEFIESKHKLTTRKRLSNSPPFKRESSKKNVKSAGSLKHRKESIDVSPSSKVRGKRTPRENLKQGSKGVSQRAAYLEMGKSKDHDISLPEAKPTNISKADDLDADKNVKILKTKEKKVKYAESSSTDTTSSQENEPDSWKKENEDVDMIPHDGSASDENDQSEIKEIQSPGLSTEISSKEANKIHKSDSEGDAQTPDRKGSTSHDFEESEFSDNEPLCVWKSRVGKVVQRK
uniref:sister chromatid cohesion protein PDS5 homolog B-like isoform X2 n=1 Tax=Erigeron canadensis TaxID=72917 RepID=UPI001CB917EB|nr:sister chromatid cohesion protein PDS5 homolog B-like isoform X2 [Erigeron canadensis]